MNTTPPVELVGLADSPYRVRSDNTDPRGWDLVDANGIMLGTVTDLIIDVGGLVARYIVCSIQRNEARSVLLPVGFARLNNENRLVHLDFITAEAVSNLPTFTGLPISAEQLAASEEALTGVTPTTSSEAKVVRRTDDATRNAS